MLNVMESRKNLYRFLSQMLVMEVDEEMLVQMKNMEFPEAVSNEYLAEGYELLKNSLNVLSADDLDDLAADYAKTFLAAGDAQGNAAFPYESVYTSKRRLVGQEARTGAEKFYADHGLEMGKTIYKIPEDHISVEMEFMARLCEKWAEEDTQDSKEENIKAQKAFFKEHIINWVVMFCADAERYAESGFYKGIAKVTRGFVQEEKALFSRS